MANTLQGTESLRERNRRQTLERIEEVAIELFLAKGYEATTLEEIAATAGISRRTFFYYFKSKDDILLARVSNYADALKAAVLENSSAKVPIEVVRNALLELSTRLDSRRTATARLIRENVVLGVRRQLSYHLLEEAVFESLSKLWPANARRDRLRLVAVTAVGILRLSVDTWLEQDGKRPLAKYIQDGFKNLKAEI